VQQEKDRLEMHRRHAKMGMLGQNIAVKALEDLLNRVQNGQSQVAPGDVTRLLDTCVKVERLARGESTGNQDLNDPLAKLLDEFRKEYDRLPEDPDAQP